MSRLPFDPKKAMGAEPITQPERLTVSQAVDLIKTTLETRMPSPLRVIGQVSNLSVRNHWYFSLKDEEAVLHCAAWATAVRKFGFTPRDGDEVVATGHISHYGPQGKTQLYVDQLTPVGAGALELKFRAMCEELRRLGYFEDARKKPLPMFPHRIAVITSATGAALQDVIATAAQRCKAVGLLIVDVRVQGEGAAKDVAKAIRWMDAQHKKLGVDAILVTRGGGSIEDLWAFNERIVADAVFKCSLPIVAAIGHESDTTIIELVADVRAATPTQAVMRLIPARAELQRHVDHLSQRMGALVKRHVQEQIQHMKAMIVALPRVMKTRFAEERARLAREVGRLVHQRPAAQLAERKSKLAVAKARLDSAMRIRIDQRPRLTLLLRGLRTAQIRHVRSISDQLAAAQRRLSALDPHGVIHRGYSITMRRDGSIVRSTGDVRAGEAVVTRVSDGAIESVVTASGGGGTARNRKRETGTPDQLDLFGSPK